jgi:hypothetical protein
MRSSIVVLVAAVMAASAGGATGAERQDPTLLMPFYPQAGILWKDLYISNHVDLDPGPGVLDYHCGAQTYDGHTGQDSVIRSFREMDIGVPVFAALDGTVISTQDGNFDRQYGATTSLYDNNIVVQHSPGRFTVYGHLRKGLWLRRGYTVVAGQQIGWTASSGNSTWPHLHFTYKEGGEVVEPFAGPCRPGASAWADQVPYPTAPYARDLAISTTPFRGRAAIPWDEGVRTGTFLRGSRRVYVRVQFGAAWNAERVTLRIVRPVGSDATRESRSMTPLARGDGELFFNHRVNFDVPGRWRLTVDIDDTRVVDGPIRVVATKSQVRNRPPNPVSLQLLPENATPDDVLQCRIQTSLVTEDPDYDIVRYRYRWTVDGRAVRTVWSAALSDVLRHRLAPAGSRVGCTVTVSDGRLSWPRRAAVGTMLG